MIDLSTLTPAQLAALSAQAAAEANRRRKAGSRHRVARELAAKARIAKRKAKRRAK